MATDRGYNALADAANDACSHDERVNMPHTISERDAALRADFEKANAQAGA